MKRNHLVVKVSCWIKKVLCNKEHNYRLNCLAKTHLVCKYTIRVMVPLVCDPICSFNLILAQRVAVLETVGRCVRDAIGRALGAAGQPQVGVWHFLETIELLKSCIIFYVADNFPCAFVVITGTPFDQKLNHRVRTEIDA